MMPLNSEQQEALTQATLDYLQTLTFIHVWDQRPRKGKDVRLIHQHHCFMQIFSSPEREGPHGLFAPREAWEAYLERVGKIGEGRINFRTISQAIDALCKQIETLPIPTEMLKEFAEKIVAWCGKVFDYSATAYVPLANIELSHDVKSLPLAETTLHRGWNNSSFAKYVQHINNNPMLSFDVPLDSPYLVVQVVGDDESIEEQIAAKTDDALRVLRFVCFTNSRMKGTKRISYNSARDVARFPFTTPAGHYLYVNADDHPFNRYLLDNSDVSPLQVDKDERELFILFGLESINQHFANANHAISAQILVALQCFIGILGNSDNESVESTTTNETPTATNEQQEEIDNESVEEMAEEYADVFKNLYDKHRGFILHGYPSNPSEQFPLTDELVEDARLLAQNAIRLIMKMIDQNPSWANRNNLEKWFSINNTDSTSS